MPAQFILVTAPAKVNLYLGVHPGKGEDGYHRVDTVMSTIDLSDTLAIAPSDELVVRMVPEADFPMEENSAYKAAVAMGEAFDRDPAFTILIDKHIPVRAGLGGPSTDAAATIMGICHYWGIDPTDPRIDAVARSIGADVAFFLYGPPAYLSGRGDVMEELYRPLTGTAVALVKPKTGGVSAADAYRVFDEAPLEPAPLEPMLEAMRDHRETDIFAQVANNLAPAACALSPEISDVLAWIRQQPDVRVAEVAGSGSCVFAVCNTQMAAERIALAALNDHHWWAQAAKMEKSGPFIAVG
ncbi:4-(cytidine 5'-diphospho)-2-C-methyl-D-erythritol kinase [Collinsella sp. BA40]|uniref:4-(cytidine 5'-diphospho)-2-C-methyl-D-erythritol kinase n=1 Tax=Collinsella sp. BA40 TaxID=2560852 RepID=UPI0011CAF6E2|nr:4-(cytidine 5'-diphospho)-2-C-methyl-D-erythritol kinase [Collinsella sp. BA40]TXF36275.1 4-(cytidine 5'-diphospho)-2-C-methyl-D-erythritol kinase [Collinsella sp. BA40]